MNPAGATSLPPRARIISRIRRVALLTLALALLTGCDSEPAKTDGAASATRPPMAASREARGPIPLAALHGQIAFSHHGQIWIADADGAPARRVTHGQGPKLDPSWSPDGNRITYRDSRHGINRNDEIYVIDADGAHASNLARSAVNDWSPAWSPRGTQIAFHSGQLWVMRPDGGDAHPVTTIEGEYPAWSPDGRRLAFMSSEPGARGLNPDYDIFVVRADGSGLRQLTDRPGEDGFPAWSPDGRRIVFASSYGGDGTEFFLYLMDADGSHLHRLLPGMTGSFPVWSPDGQAILFTGGRSNRSADALWVVRPDGSGPRRLPLTGWLADWRR